MLTDAERPDSTTAAAVGGECCINQYASVEVGFCLLLFHSANVITSCDVQVKPPTQGVQSEAGPVAPNSQSAPAVSPQVCCSPCYGLKSMVAATVRHRNTLILHFHNNSFL